MCATVRVLSVLTLLLCAFSQEIGQRCTLKDGTVGKCENVTNCSSAQEELRLRKRSVLCGLEQHTPIVCCVLENKITQAKESLNISVSEQRKYESPKERNNLPDEGPKVRISEQKCREYRDLLKEPSTIFGGGGDDAEPREFSHMALLGYHNVHNDTIEYKCGGSLISEQFVLTAAHCLEARDLGPVYAARLGELDTATDDDDADPQDFKIIETYPHPDYDFESFYNDIAVIKLDRPVEYTVYVKPACLQFETKLKRDRFIATGWGALFYGGDMHNILQKLDLMSLPIENCLPTYKPQRRLLKGIDEELQICGGNLEKRVDTCQGDSGGPLQFKIEWEPPVHRVVGVTSFGAHCNLVPGIYTRVSKYISWIESVVWPN